jgi:hypothetical protein
MLLRILKSNTPFSSLLIPAIGFLFWFQSLHSPQILNQNMVQGAMPLYYPFYHYLAGQGFWQVFIGFTLVVINSFFVAQIGSSFLILKKQSYLPGIIYLITVSSVKGLQALLPVHLATFFVLVSILFIFDTYHKKVEITYTFNASFFLALASLFYLPALVLVPLVWISIFVLQKEDNWRVLIIPTLGFSTPWLFMWTYSFLNDSFSSIWKEIIAMLWTHNNAYLIDPFFLFLTAVVTFLTTLGSLSVISAYHRMKVSSRKYFVIFYWMLGLVVVSALALITIGIEIVILSTIPVAYFISQYLLSDKRIIWKEVLTWVYFATMISALYLY